MKSRKEKDLELWEAYNRSPGPYTLKPLMKQLNPVIQNEVNKWAGAIARPVLEAKAKALTLEAIKSYDPNAGAALATHVTNRLLKLSRTVYTHQDAVRLPEHKKLKVNAYFHATNELKTQYGREPTSIEIADHMAWSPGLVSQIESAITPELIESEDMGAGLFETQSIWSPNSDDGMVEMIYFDLDPTDKLIFEHSTGYSGRPILSNPELMKKTGLTQGQLSYRKKKLVDKIKRELE